jgi:hypothetical protein
MPQLLWMETVYPVEHAAATIYCDNLKAIHRTSNHAPLNIKVATADDYDIKYQV